MPRFLPSMRRSSTLAATPVTCPPPALGAELVAATPWQRLLAWLLAPSPQAAASMPRGRLQGVRAEFLKTLEDVDAPTAHAEQARSLPERVQQARLLREKVQQARSLRELWHLRAEAYGLVALAHSQHEAQQRLAALNRHFPARAPRSQFGSL